MHSIAFIVVALSCGLASSQFIARGSNGFGNARQGVIAAPTTRFGAQDAVHSQLIGDDSLIVAQQTPYITGQYYANAPLTRGINIAAPIRQYSAQKYAAPIQQYASPIQRYASLNPIQYSSRIQEYPTINSHQYSLPIQAYRNVQYAPAGSRASILRQAQDVSFDGTYNYGFESDDGIAVQANGGHKALGGDETAHVAQGSYSYTSPDGTPIVTNWYADENGFHAEGAHLPQGPILRSK